MLGFVACSVSNNSVRKVYLVFNYFTGENKGSKTVYHEGNSFCSCLILFLVEEY